MWSFSNRQLLLKGLLPLSCLFHIPGSDFTLVKGVFNGETSSGRTAARDLQVNDRLVLNLPAVGWGSVDTLLSELESLKGPAGLQHNIFSCNEVYLIAHTIFACVTMSSQGLFESLGNGLSPN